MKKNLNLLTAFLLLTGMIACNKEKEIDMSGIDFSNIENLYEQPLPVIQKAIQGRWKYTGYCGGVAGCTDVTDVYFTFTANEIIYENTTTGEHSVRRYSWKRKKIRVSIMNSDEIKTVNAYLMWPEGADEQGQSGYIFMSIKNDYLSARSFSLEAASDYSVFGFGYTRVKE